MFFVENEEMNVLENVELSDREVIMEGFIEEVGVQNFSEAEIMGLVELGLLSERSIVRLDKNAHRSRAKKKAALQLAKESNDPNYKKLIKVYKLKKVLLERIQKKFGAKAESEVRKMKFTAKGRVDKASDIENRPVAKAVKKILNNNSAKKSTDI